MRSIVLAASLALASCASVCANGEQSITGVLELSKGGWTVGGLVFEAREPQDLERVIPFVGERVRMTGTLVRHRVEPCATPQCRTGEAYYVFEPLRSIEALR